MPQLDMKLEKKITRAGRLRKRVLAIKPILLELGWNKVTDILLKYYPEYDSFHQAIIVYYVWNGRSTDTKLTEIFEDIAKGKLHL